VLNYDRLNNGGSDKLDAYTTGHGITERETLRGMTEMARAGTLGKHLHAGSALPHVGPFDTVIHVGHSFGSQITASLLTLYGNLSSGAILTGLLFTTQPTKLTTVAQGFAYAATNNPALYGNSQSGYIIPDDTNRLQTGFFHRYNDTDPAGFTNDALAYAEGIKSPITVAEWLSTQGLLPIGPAPAFTGPIQFFAGEFDEIVCSGDCNGNYIPATLEKVYPNATARDIYLQPSAGHGLTLHRNASAGYAVMTEFLDSHGL
jgi:pimeloyl-ACP methyl ester carboxylesterase